MSKLWSARVLCFAFAFFHFAFGLCASIVQKSSHALYGAYAHEATSALSVGITTKDLRHIYRHSDIITALTSL